MANEGSADAAGSGRVRSGSAPFGGVSGSAIGAGLVAALVGFSSSFAVVLQGLTAAGAGPAQAASGLMALAVAMGLCAVVLAPWTRMPVSVAWSTPGAALLAASPALEGGFPAAVGAFLIANAAIVLAGLVRPFGRAVAAIPSALASAMLAGVLLGLCVAPARAVAERPAEGLAIVLVWALVGRWRRLWAAPAAVAVTLGLVAWSAPEGAFVDAALAPAPVFVAPVFSLEAAIGLALPLFVVTMASQNVPGVAVLRANGYAPDAGLMFRATGLFGLAAAPFGGHAVNLAAITAALCAGPDAHPDPARRWWAAAASGVAYVVLGLGAGLATAAIAVAPPVLIAAVAGLALLGALAASASAAFADPREREAAAVVFVTAASGVSFMGVSGAFWGLIAGGALWALGRAGRRDGSG